VQVWSKSISNEGQFTVAAEIFFRPYLAKHYGRVAETSHAALKSDGPQGVAIWLKPGRSERHFTLEAETVFRPYLPSH
jgi:hypothetical protein